MGRNTSSQRIAKNTAFLYLRMLIVMVINIFSVRYVLKGLGVIDYGVFNVVAGLVTMFHSISNVISTATLRFHSYAIGKKNQDEVNDVYTASVNIFALLCLVILILGEAVGVWFINSQADIPDDRMLTANWLFQFTMLTFIVSLMTVPFSSLIFAFERMSVFSVISIAECILKFLLAYFLLYLSGDHLFLYGLGLLLIQFGHFFAYYFSSRFGKCDYHYKRKVESSLYKKMLSFSGWTLFSSSASIGISQLVTMVTNVFFGPIVNAARSIAFQLNSAMNSFTGNIIMAVRPPMIKQFAEGDYEKVNRFFYFSNKAVFYSLLLILLPVFFEMEMVLKIWLDVSDVQTVLFCRLILIYCMILSLNNPIAIIIQATGNIRSYSTFVEIPTLLCFPFTWFLYAKGYPAEYAFYVMIISVTISHIIRLVCLKHQFSLFTYKRYLMSFIIPALSIMSLTACGLFIVTKLFEISILRLLVSFVTCAVLIGGAGWFCGLNKYERDVLLSLLKISHLKRLFKAGR